MRVRRRAELWLLVALAGCGGTEAPATEHESSSESAARAADVRAESAAAALDQWNEAEVIKRLEEAGLVVADSGVAPPAPPLATSGARLFVSGSELRLYVFENAEARRRASAGLDTVPPPAGYAAVWRSRPRVYVVNNLVALLYTPNDRLAERVENVLTARHLGR